MLFSQRHGYKKVSEVLLRETMTEEIQNGICTCYDDLEEKLNGIAYYSSENEYENLERYLWVWYLHKRENDFYSYNGHMIVATQYIKSKAEWYEKLDLVELSIQYLYSRTKQKIIPIQYVNDFKAHLNLFFKHLNYAYRIVGNEIVEVTSDEEIKTIETTIATTKDNVRMHLQTALEKLSERPKGDYRNSIKESISAVEAFCRNITGKDSLGNALAELEKRGMMIPSSLRTAFNNMYGYTNSKDTGIRHPLMEITGSYIPSADEAIYMHVVCCAFINYLRKKLN